MQTTYSVDVAIIGGGIAGLWTLNHLVHQGYNAVLLEHQGLGGGQTLASQGMIHGGMKYTLGGALTGASEAIADMPDHWRACLRGEGDVDLRGTKPLSEHFHMWSTASLSSRLGGFLASKAVRGRVDPLNREQLPELFRHHSFRGKVYRLVDMVMDTPSLVRTLAANMAGRLFAVDWHDADLVVDDSGACRLSVDNGNAFSLSAAAWVFSAGEGNEALLTKVGSSTPRMQRRPLKQVMVRHHLPYRFYGHCLGAETTPRLTISSHPLSDGSQVWYLGGSLAEKGAGQSDAEVLASAQAELADLMPWLNFSDAQWAVLAVDRAEPRQRNLARPDQAFADWARGADGTALNAIAAWPTKLTLAPNLARQVSERLLERELRPSGAPPPALPLAAPPIAATPWATAFGVADATA
ncbi:MAG: FAD-dependent oxidoreductase [Porticoccaceae bacterium]|nr:FAD-dependent oxidoreductase [Porticoccaceae bacterium]